jgi:hypothetical protein
MTGEADLRAFARRHRAEVQALKREAHARSPEARLRAAGALAEALSPELARGRAEDLLHHVELAARLRRFDRVRVR